MEIKKPVDYLRLSITDRCNLNCIYCTPLERTQFLTHEQVLRYEEMTELVKLFVKAGISKVRITGGEPLIKKNIVELVIMLKAIKGLKEVSLTTNGVELSKYVNDLKKAGLDRINISLDTLKKDRYKSITGKDLFSEVWKSIKSALDAEIHPLKLNVVPMNNINDDEIIDFARLTLKYPLTVRFIEFFHTNQRSQKLIDSLMPSKEIKTRITGQLGNLQAVSGIKGEGPAQYYTLKKAKGAIGFISGSTTNFCHNCNRIRVDCSGKISPCLFSGHTYDAAPFLREGQQEEKIVEDIRGIMRSKANYTKETTQTRKIEMSGLGG